MEEILKIMQAERLRRTARILEPSTGDFLQKGQSAQEGEVRTWNGRKMRKQGDKWVPVGPERKKAPESGKKERGKKADDDKRVSGPNDQNAMMKPKLNISSKETAELKRIKEALKEGDLATANKLAEGLGDEAKNVIPASEWSKMNEHANPTKKDTKAKAVDAEISEDERGRLKAWASKNKEMFDTGEHAHPDRSKAAKFLRAKGKGFVKGLKHEIEHIKEAGSAIGKVFSGKASEINDHEKKALKKVGISLGLTVATMLATGGVSAFSHGFASAAKHVGLHFIEHGLLETAGLSAIFAKAERGEELTDVDLQEIVDRFIEYFENGDWSDLKETMMGEEEIEA